MDVVKKEYQIDSNLKKDDVKLLQNWLESQPHLPKMTEQEIIWFLQSCYLNIEATKITIDNYFTMRTMSPEILGNWDQKRLLKRMEVLTFSILPKKTPDGSSIFIGHLKDPNHDIFHFNDNVRLFDMIVMSDLYKNPGQGHLRFCFDMKDISYGHLGRVGIMAMKKFLYYLQDGMPIRLKGLHLFNVTPFMDKFLILLKPLVDDEILAKLYLHNTLEDMTEFVPIECLPSDLGGKQKSFAQLNAEMKKIVTGNIAFFDHQESQLVDESKREGQSKSVSEIFGIPGTFRKYE